MNKIQSFYDAKGLHLSQSDPQKWSRMHDLSFTEIDPETGEIKTESLSKVQEQFLDESDINSIVRRARLTGILPSGERAPQYGDFTQVFDYHTAQNTIAVANNAFAELPSELRAMFKNDPALWLDYMSDPKNRDEAVELGLLPPSGAETPHIAAQEGDGNEVPTPAAPPPAKAAKGAPKPEKTATSE